MTYFWTIVYVLFVLASFVGLGVIRRASRLPHTPLPSIANGMSAIAVVGAILVGGGDYLSQIRTLGTIALFASITSIVSDCLMTGRVPQLFKTNERRPEVSRQGAGAAA